MEQCPKLCQGHFCLSKTGPCAVITIPGCQVIGMVKKIEK